MNPDRNAGLALFEILIALGLAAIMTAAIAPPLIDHRHQNQIAQARSDAQAVGDAILLCHAHVGDWPIRAGAGTSSDLAEMVGAAAMSGNHGGGMADIGPGRGKEPDWEGWNVLGIPSELLVQGRGVGGDQLPEGSDPVLGDDGWRGPYLDEIPRDPWGSSYLVCVYGLPARDGNGFLDNVMVLSPGPNQIFDTAFADNRPGETPAGDDIGYVIRGTSRQ